jgi:peptidoglycan/LPS O-acetylase OafA/YrhL
VAVILVVLFHSGISTLSGGYIGVDVFFVISGFVITGVLLRERASTGRTSILAFYGRRCRRIVPAATVVIIVTVFLSYFFLGIGAGDGTATDGRWASVFLANFHFTAIGTNYLSAQQPPSPLQNYWSLSVEEQFYVVYPALFLLVAAIRTRLSLRARLGISLVLVIGASLAFSIIDTSSNATGAYFSPFTRAWELGLGALVAVGTPWLRKVPSRVAAMSTWIGFGAVLVCAFTFTTQTAYPGSLVIIPVLGAALIIGGGMRAGHLGVEALLGLAPAQTLGKLSYSLYLWHWPILIIAAEYVGKTSLGVPQNLGWDLVALGASALTYVAVENPVRHAKVLFRVRWASVGLGITLVAVTLGVITLRTNVANASGGGPEKASRVYSRTASLHTVLQLVAESKDIQTVSANLIPPLPQAVTEPLSNLGVPTVSTGCWPAATQSTVPACAFGDRTGSHTMVLYGDSHAGMWFKALNDIATRARWRLVVLTKGSCPASDLPTHPTGATGEWVACDRWHRFAINRIDKIAPDLLLVSQAAYDQTPAGLYYTPANWERGLEQLLRRVSSPNAMKVVLGEMPSSGGPGCLAHHTADVQACSVPIGSFVRPYSAAERRAADRTKAQYIDITPWFCVKTCSSIIGKYSAYYITNHVALGYSRFLEGVLAQALDLPRFGLANRS